MKESDFCLQDVETPWWYAFRDCQRIQVASGPGEFWLAVTAIKRLPAKDSSMAEFLNKADGQQVALGQLQVMNSGAKFLRKAQCYEKTTRKVKEGAVRNREPRKSEGYVHVGL